MENEYLPFGGPRPRKTRNTKRRVNWRNYSFAYTNIWQLFDDTRDVWIGPALIAQIRAFRQQLYEHRYLIAEASDLGDTDAQEMLRMTRDAYTQIVTEGQVSGFAMLHIVTNPVVKLVNDALVRAGKMTAEEAAAQAVPPGAALKLPLIPHMKEKEIEEIKKQLDRLP